MFQSKVCWCEQTESATTNYKLETTLQRKPVMNVVVDRKGHPGSKKQKELSPEFTFLKSRQLFILRNIFQDQMAEDVSSNEPT